MAAKSLLYQEMDLTWVTSQSSAQKEAKEEKMDGRRWSEGKDKEGLQRGRVEGRSNFIRPPMNNMQLAS